MLWIAISRISYKSTQSFYIRQLGASVCRDFFYTFAHDMNTPRPIPYTLNLGGRLVSLDRPLVMGILNVTTESFYEASQMHTADAIARRARAIVSEGGAIIDIGACSTKPGLAPVSEEEELRRLAEDEEFRRRVRREVLRIQSGEADEDIEADKEQVREEQEREQAEAVKKQRRRSRLFWQLFSGNILVTSSVKANYSYLIAIAVMCFVSIFVMFTALYADLRYSRVEREVQLVRERSIRLQEQLYGKTTHAAIREELQRRGINLQDPQKTKEVVED